MRAACRALPTFLRALRQPPSCPLPLRSFRPLATAAAASTSPFQLRDYQEECIQTVLQHIDLGHRRMGVSLATGSGKTVIFTQLIERLTHPTSPDATQTLILVHRKELVEQAARHCQQHYPHMSVEIEMASAKASGLADITIASIQSITSGDRISKFDASRFKLILVDECHHAVAKKYLECLDHFGLLEATEESPVLVGVSATMSRFDGLKLGKVLDHIVYHRDYMDMIKDNWLSPCHFTTVKTSVDLSQVRKAPTGDFNIGELGRVVNTHEANEVTVRAWLEKAGQRKSTLVFCVDIAHVNDLTAHFRKYGVDARPITSNTILQDRRERLAAFKQGEFRVLVNCGVFTEGTDIPNIDCVLLARPTRSKNLLVQMIGRGMRLHPGKEDCHVIDMVGTIEKGIVTVPTLFGLDPSEVVDNATVESMKAKAEAQALEAAAAAAEVELEDEDEIDADPGDGEPRPLNITFTDYETVWDLIADSAEELHIRRSSDYAWVTVDRDRYVLSLQQGGYIKIERVEDGTFTVTSVQRLPSDLARGRFVNTPPRVIIEHADSLIAAAQGADTFASKRCHRGFLLLNAPWRSGPASEQQLEYLERFRERFGLHGTLTKGQAGDMITKLRHGAIARFKKAQQDKKRAEREAMSRVKREEKERKKAEKERAKDEAVQQLRKREEVKVGRLEA